MDEGTASRFSSAPDVVACQLQDQTVLLDTRQGSYFTLNPVAAECWALLGEGRTLDELADHVARSYEIERAACRADIAALLNRLVEAGLVEPVQDHGPVHA